MTASPTAPEPKTKDNLSSGRTEFRAAPVLVAATVATRFEK
jgi:hypothetical protein